MRALYIGSFDPFTIGHYEVLKQAEELFDDVFVCVANNPTKKRRFNVLSCKDAIQSITKSKVGFSEALTTEMMRIKYCQYLIRGLRSTSDYLYEETLLKQYKIIMPELKVVYFRANNDVSSSFVYELYKRRIDISPYIPYDVNLLREPICS